MTITDTIAAQIDTMHAAPSPLPAEIAAVFGAEQAAMNEAGLPTGLTSIGSPMPDGDLLDTAGLPTTLAATRGDRPAVVVFYRGAWCPYCNLTLRTYQQQLAVDLAERGIALVAISPQQPDGSLSAQEADSLTYTVLSDPGNQIAGQLGILTKPSADALAAQQQLGLDLTVVNADGTANLPMPTVAIVSATGELRWIDVHPNYATRTEPQQILDAIAQTLTV